MSKYKANDELFFTIGTIVNAHGIHGEVRVLPSTDDPERFALLKSVFIIINKNQIEYTMERTRLHKSFVVVKLRGVDDRTAAEQMVGGILRIPPELALPLMEDEYYHRDLLGLRVVTEAGELLGVLTDILETGANDVYVVRSEWEEILIPAVKDCIIYVDKECMTVRLIDGLRK